jgi:hypothetical protein
MDLTDCEELDENSDTALNFIYLIEKKWGYCYLLFYSESAIRERGGQAEVEASLFAEYPWFESLGTIVVRSYSGGFRFSEEALEGLVLRSSRRMTRTPNCDEFEYIPLDSRSSSRN